MPAQERSSLEDSANTKETTLTPRRSPVLPVRVATVQSTLTTSRSPWPSRTTFSATSILDGPSRIHLDGWREDALSLRADQSQHPGGYPRPAVRSETDPGSQQRVGQQLHGLGSGNHFTPVPESVRHRSEDQLLDPADAKQHQAGLGGAQHSYRCQRFQSRLRWRDVQRGIQREWSGTTNREADFVDF